MNVVSMAEEIKKEHPEEVVCYKMGGIYTIFWKRCICYIMFI